ncbi:phosphoserine phosphatase SerB [Notoacmeibacter sp. MSK16QG-6]|uniref:phosphoserine phosphatase SerB n=1 Tax=Notoacmeibacter sp. MSK16QG-6 TaxID=2957982 RepID=UPI00209C6F4E|nr:phosphoserine phosphatase SerB [Notoacmeibacter sp. MSK16QG-6]MCP1199651.1 phosphoserine phosphatase SerB [Notoacmeibacter sp. MSK16QG-6]
MPLVATLITAPGSMALSPEQIEKAQNITATPARILADGEACDLIFPADTNERQTEDRLRALLSGQPVDIVVQDEAVRRKRILVADMDSTMIEQECIDELADMIGVKDRVAAITSRAMNGEIAFEPALRERVALLRDLPVSVIDEVIEKRITLMPGGRELVGTMKGSGAYCALVSGGFTAFTNRVAALLGFNENRANRLIERDGKLTGEVAEPILGRDAKVSALREVAEANGATPADAMAVGDGANDLGMIQIAGSGVALHAKPAVAEQARFRIDHGDLTALLYMQGYRKSEFAA